MFINKGFLVMLMNMEGVALRWSPRQQQWEVYDSNEYKDIVLAKNKEPTAAISEAFSLLSKRCPPSPYAGYYNGTDMVS